MPSKTGSHISKTQQMRVLEGFAPVPDGLLLEHGGRIAEGRIAYRLAGIPGAPVVCVLGGISADRIVAVQERDTGRGWWEWMVGTGRPLDTRVHQVLSIDYLFGPGESRGAVVKDTRAPAASDAVTVPLVTPLDQAHTLAAVTDALELDPLCGLIGASYGGAVALAFAATYPEKLLRACVIGAADSSHPLATAWRVVQRRIVQRAVAVGDEAGGIALARVLAMTTYRSDIELQQRFSGPPSITEEGLRFPVEDYLDHHGQSFARRFTADQFLCLSQSSDLHVIEAEHITIPVTLVSTDPDFLAPRWQMEDLARRMGDGHQLVRVSSLHGHDAFLTDEARFSAIIKDFVVACGAAAGQGS